MSRITDIEIYGYGLTYAHGEYAMSKGRTATQQQSTLVRLRTDDGLEGWGESSTLAGTYLPAFTEGTREAIRVMAPALIGEDATNLVRIHQIMASILLDQNSAKSAIDIACWDILGKKAGLPIARMIGGIAQERFPLYEAVPLADPQAMADFVKTRRETGVNRWQVKVGNDPYDDASRLNEVLSICDSSAVIVADSNGGWTLPQAMIAVRECEGMDIYLEQPCRDTADCALVKRNTALPLSMDESVTNAAELYRAKYEANACALNIKLARVGGITGAVSMRNQAQDLGLTMCIEDVWGGDVTTAAVAHVAASTRPEALLHAAFFNDWTVEKIAHKAIRSERGTGAVSDAPGLGVEVDLPLLGKPLAAIA